MLVLVSLALAGLVAGQSAGGRSVSLSDGYETPSMDVRMEDTESLRRLQQDSDTDGDGAAMIAAAIAIPVGCLCLCFCMLVFCHWYVKRKNQNTQQLKELEHQRKILQAKQGDLPSSLNLSGRIGRSDEKPAKYTLSFDSGIVTGTGHRTGEHELEARLGEITVQVQGRVCFREDSNEGQIRWLETRGGDAPVEVHGTLRQRADGIYVIQASCCSRLVPGDYALTLFSADGSLPAQDAEESVRAGQRVPQTVALLFAFRHILCSNDASTKNSTNRQLLVCDGLQGVCQHRFPLECNGKWFISSDPAIVQNAGQCCTEPDANRNSKNHSIQAN